MEENREFRQERRIFERFSAVMPVSLIDLDAGRELAANTCDVSAKGVGVESEECLTPGGRLELRLEIKDGRDPFYTKGTVMWAGQQGAGKYRAGILFEKAELMGMARIFRS